jgi:hypothetical protein
VLLAPRIALLRAIKDPAEEQQDDEEGDEPADQRPVHARKVIGAADLPARGASSAEPEASANLQFLPPPGRNCRVASGHRGQPALPPTPREKLQGGRDRAQVVGIERRVVGIERRVVGIERRVVGD